MKEFLLAALTGHGVLLPAGAFALAGALVFAVASRLAHNADLLADATGLGRLWIGSLLLAASTSLPEIVTDVGAAMFALPNIGVGDVFGSTLANMLLLAFLLIVYERRRILEQAAIDHALVGALAIVLAALAGLSLASGGLGRIYNIGVDTLAIALIYVLGMRIVFDLTQRPAAAARVESPEERKEDPRVLTRRALRAFLYAAAGLALTAPLLVLSAQAFAIETGLSNSFVGVTLVGFTTSFPEIAAAIAAVRLGAVDLAVGNIFGSNAFNMTVLLFMDIAYRGKPLLAAVERDHVVSAFSAVLALAFGVMAILARTHRKIWVSRTFAAAIIFIYALNVYLLNESAS